MSKDENMVIIKAGLEQLDLVAELFDKYRIFYEQPSNLAEGKKFIRERMENGQSVIFLAIEKQESSDHSIRICSALSILFFSKFSQKMDTK